jgi:hypothetical protein
MPITPAGLVFTPYVKGTSEKFRCIQNCYNIETIFKTRHTLRSLLTEQDLKEDHNRWSTVSTVFPTVRFSEYRHKQRDGLLEKSKLVPYAHEGHKLGWVGS